MHIEQARVLQDTGKRIGIVDAIAGYVHADVFVTGRGDHAGATPMGLRLDPTTVLAETVLELERLATEAGGGTVGTVGEIELDPSLINAVAAEARFSLDVRGPQDALFQGVARDTAAFAERAAERRGMTARTVQRQSLPATPLDAGGRRRAGGGRRRVGRAVDDDALGRRARHDVRRRARAERHGLRPVHRRDQPSPGRGGRPGRCRARGRDHPERDRGACGSDGAWTPSCSACWPARSSAR